MAAYMNMRIHAHVRIMLSCGHVGQRTNEGDEGDPADN